jgi:hypothetical protein
MDYIILIEWGNGNKTFEVFQYLKDAGIAFHDHKANSEIEHMKMITTGRTIFTWSNPDCCSE